MEVLAQLKRGLLHLDTLSAYEFTALQKKITNKEYIKSVNVFFTRLFKLYDNQYGVNLKTTRIYLSAYVIMNYLEEVTKKDTYSIKLQNHAVETIMSLENLFTKEKITLKDYNNFMNSFNRYVEFFQVWRERDSLIMVRPIINSYFDLEKQKQYFEEQKQDEKANDIGRVMTKLKHNIRLIGGKKGLEFLEKREVPIYKDEEIFKNVEKTVRKAFWDVVKQNMDENKYDQVVLLLDDVKTLLLEINPKLSNEMNDTINKELLTQIMENNGLTYDSILLYTTYIIEHIEKMQAVAEDENTKMWKENITTMINKKEKHSDILVYFFENAFGKLEKIKYLTLHYRELIKGRSM